MLPGSAIVNLFGVSPLKTSMSRPIHLETYAQVSGIWYLFMYKQCGCDVIAKNHIIADQVPGMTDDANIFTKIGAKDIIRSIIRCAALPRYTIPEVGIWARPLFTADILSGEATQQCSSTLSLKPDIRRPPTAMCMRGVV